MIRVRMNSSVCIVATLIMTRFGWAWRTSCAEFWRRMLSPGPAVQNRRVLFIFGFVLFGSSKELNPCRPITGQSRPTTCGGRFVPPCPNVGDPGLRLASPACARAGRSEAQRHPLHLDRLALELLPTSPVVAGASGACAGRSALLIRSCLASSPSAMPRCWRRNARLDYPCVVRSRTDCAIVLPNWPRALLTCLDPSRSNSLAAG